MKQECIDIGHAYGKSQYQYKDEDTCEKRCLCSRCGYESVIEIHHRLKDQSQEKCISTATCINCDYRFRSEHHSWEHHEEPSDYELWLGNQISDWQLRFRAQQGGDVNESSTYWICTSCGQTQDSAE